VLVFLDPGHGGIDQGTSGTTADGGAVNEKTISLAIAQLTAQQLRSDGIGVALSRTDDSLPGTQPADYTTDGTALTPEGVFNDLQRRVDRANASGAQVFLSIHLNAFTDPAVGGNETFYDSGRPFSDQNVRIAQLVQDSVTAALRAHGYNVVDRGTSDDTSLQGDNLGAVGMRYAHLVVLGPDVPGHLRATAMPGALSEPLFLTNPGEATLAAMPETQDLIAHAYVTAIETFLRSY
jgi:N-acetylmuramoyl-L-alanine amidase